MRPACARVCMTCAALVARVQYHGTPAAGCTRPVRSRSHGVASASDRFHKHLLQHQSPMFQHHRTMLPDCVDKVCFSRCARCYCNGLVAVSRLASELRARRPAEHSWHSCAIADGARGKRNVAAVCVELHAMQRYTAEQKLLYKRADIKVQSTAELFWLFLLCLQMGFMC